MTKFALTAALLLTAVAAPAFAAKEKISFTEDGVSYTYTQTKVGQSTVIDGRSSTGNDFYFVVNKGRVVGKSNGIPVNFSVADAVSQRGNVSLRVASR